MKILIFILLLCSTVFSQFYDPIKVSAGCPSTIEKSPSIRQIKLGMSKDDVTKHLILVKSLIQYEEFQETFSSNKFLHPEHFSMIRNIETTFFKENLLSFEVFYDDYSSTYPKWKDSSEFAQSISKEWDIPFTFWEIISSSKATLKCKELTIDISTTSASIRLTDLIQLKAFKTFKEQLEEEKKNKFKP